ncbi:MAG: CPBP family glutamic-type intramembrane protease [Pseudomonadota bacterium]
MTTSPLTPQEIDETFGDVEPAARPTTALREWSQFYRFVKSPRLPVEGASHSGAARATGRMLGLDMVFMVGFIAALGLASALGFTPPENINSTLEPNLFNLFLIVVFAPLGEEILFRSWLSGRPSVIAAVLIAIVGFGLLPALGMRLEDGTTRQIVLIAGPAMAIVGVPLAGYFLLGKATPGFFRRAFAVLFWLSSIGFALIHLANYTEGSLAILLPLVLPQFALGTMLAYLRVHYGFITALALHALHNALLFGLAVLGGLGSEAGAA